MTESEIKANLTAEQWDLYGIHSTRKPSRTDPGMNDILEALAERNRLLKGLIEKATMDESMHCLTVKISEPMFQIIQDALKGVGE